MSKIYDVIIAGGSISGLMAARELCSHNGISVLVLEEDYEVGTPEHCGGLVSMGAIEKLQILPSVASIQNNIKKAKILSPSNDFVIDAGNQKVIVLNRRELDKQIAFEAQDAGAEIRVRCSVRSVVECAHTIDSNVMDDGNLYSVSTSEGEMKCKYFIDARGIGSIIHKNRTGVLQTAQYEVYAPWIDSDTIEVKFDNIRFPGFFAWIIPTDSGKGKVGVGGRALNVADALKSYLDSKGSRYTIVRKVYSPIWVMGPLDSFLCGRRYVVVGDAAGQTKPTTAGGIYTCGMGGILAGRSMANAIENCNQDLLKEYEKEWFLLFNTEFNKMLLARKIFERLDNRGLDEIFASVSHSEIDLVSQTGDFDFHSNALSRIIGAKKATRIIKSVVSNELRRLLD
ncbi:MAG TPA: NAD(P)/FAD-dependent oxidoreductase [Nitrososphaeraceae archaeon]|nr:NAD(P)/FAD-dependent oxidoreductase [Nitrososphaeraceae archaeon]